jgi:hypothetical protein
MASFHTKTFIKHDDYMTPRSAWEAISNIIPRDKVIWEPFYGDGKSGEHLREITGNIVIHEPIDFFENNLGDIIVSNPPFSKAAEILERLVELDKPFILIMPCSKITTQYVRKLFSDKEDVLQIIIPRKRIHFEKQINGVVPDGWKNSCNFDCFYYCWKIGLDRDIIWLD